MSTHDVARLAARLARQVRTLYYARRQAFSAERGLGYDARVSPAVRARWDGLPDAAGNAQPAVWPLIVRHAARHRLDPALLVEAAFGEAEGMQPPPPYALLRNSSAAAAERHREREQRTRVIERQFYSDQASAYFTTLQSRYEQDDEGTWRLLILSSPPNLSPLFRYCLAVRAGFDDLAAEYAEDALADYFWSSEAYDAAWGDLIPERLKPAADELRGLLADGAWCEQAGVRRQGDAPTSDGGGQGRSIRPNCPPMPQA